MEQWTRERWCVVCAAPFSLATHNNDAARYAAKHLQDGTLDPSVLPAVVSKCPKCIAASGTQSRTANSGPSPVSLVSSAKEQRAVAAAMAISQELEYAQYDDVYYYTKRIGLATGVLSIFGIALVIGYALLRQEGFHPLPWCIGTGLVGIGGFAASFWAFRRSRD